MAEPYPAAMHALSSVERRDADGTSSLTTPPGDEHACLACAFVTELTVYDVNTCTMCRQLARLLTEREIEFDAVEYHVTGLTAVELRDLLAKAGAQAHDFLRAREATAVGLDTSALDEDALISAMVENPALVQRPIVVRGDRALLARPVERVLELLDD
jgi:arsenate reductase